MVQSIPDESTTPDKQNTDVDLLSFELSLIFKWDK